MCSGGVFNDRVNGSSCYTSMRRYMLCGGEGDREAIVGRVDHYDGVADGYIDDLHFAPDCLEGRDEGRVLTCL